MAERVNRRRRANIRARVSKAEKKQLLDRKRALGAKTWRQFMFNVSSEVSRGTDLSKVALLSATVSALQEGPTAIRDAQASLLRLVDRLNQLVLLNPDRAELNRRSIESTLRDVRKAIEALDDEVHKSELACSPARDEIVRVLKSVYPR